MFYYEWEGFLVVVKGKPVKNLSCPTCGCKTLVATLGRGWRKGNTNG